MAAGLAASAGLAVGAGCWPAPPYDGAGPLLWQAWTSITASEAPPTPSALNRNRRRVRLVCRRSDDAPWCSHVVIVEPSLGDTPGPPWPRGVLALLRPDPFTAGRASSRRQRA